MGCAVPSAYKIAVLLTLAQEVSIRYSLETRTRTKSIALMPDRGYGDLHIHDGKT